MNEVVIRDWPVTEATRTALRLAEERGQLVSAVRRGDVVRVVLCSPAPTGPRQAHHKPRQVSTRRLVIVGLSVGAGVPLGIGACSAGRQAATWVGNNLALLLGSAALLLVVAGVVTWLLMGGGGGDKHPCNR